MHSRGDRGLAAVLVGALLGVAAVRSCRPLDDPDAWWHLRLGNDLIGQGWWWHPPADWSRFGTQHWTLSEPLPEVVAAFVERVAGLPGLAMLFGLSVLVVIAVVHGANRRLADQLPAAIATLLAVVGSSGSLSSRPQLVSFALLAVTLGAWRRAEQLGPRIWWLVPMTLLWAWCHGFWIIGVALSGVAWLGLALDRRLQGRQLWRGAAVVLASLAMGLLTPSSWRIYLAPLEVRATSHMISEWAAPTLSDPRAWCVTLMALLALLAWRAAPSLRSWSRVLLLVVALVLAWSAVRTIAIAAIAAAPMCAEALQVLRGASEVTRPTRVDRRWFAAAVACVAVLIISVTPFTSREPGDVHTGLDPALDALPSGTVVFNHYSLGGWLAWRHPDLERVVDGLVVPYPADYVKDYVDATRSESAWRPFFQRVHAGAALIPAGSDLAERLRNEGWQEAATDDGYSLLTAPR